MFTDLNTSSSSKNFTFSFDQEVLLTEDEEDLELSITDIDNLGNITLTSNKKMFVPSFGKVLDSGRMLSAVDAKILKSVMIVKLKSADSDQFEILDMTLIKWNDR